MHCAMQTVTSKSGVIESVCALNPQLTFANNIFGLLLLQQTCMYVDGPVCGIMLCCAMLCCVLHAEASP